jgi:hypothetical protein
LEIFAVIKNEGSASEYGMCLTSMRRSIDFKKEARPINVVAVGWDQRCGSEVPIGTASTEIKITMNPRRKHRKPLAIGEDNEGKRSVIKI